MRSFVRELRRWLQRANVPLLLPGLLCLAAAIVGLALNVSGVNVPVLQSRTFWGRLRRGRHRVRRSAEAGVPAVGVISKPEPPASRSPSPNLSRSPGKLRDAAPSPAGADMGNANRPHRR